MPKLIHLKMFDYIFKVPLDFLKITFVKTNLYIYISTILIKCK